jgi:hypothetical protein
LLFGGLLSQDFFMDILLMLRLYLDLVVRGNWEVKMLIVIGVKGLSIGIDLLNEVDFSIFSISIISCSNVLADIIILSDASWVKWPSRVSIIIISFSIISIQILIVVKVSVPSFLFLFGKLALLLNNLRD